MKLYHVNPRTGNPQVCGAEAGNCPFGTHTFSERACRELYERVMAEYTIPKPMTRANTRRPVAGR